jgi:hypothetical protein
MYAVVMQRPDLSLVLGVILLFLGAGCWNYSRDDSREHHIEWSAEHGLPAPSDELRHAGYGMVVLAVVMVIAGIRFRKQRD